MFNFCKRHRKFVLFITNLSNPIWWLPQGLLITNFNFSYFQYNYISSFFLPKLLQCYLHHSDYPLYATSKSQSVHWTHVPLLCNLPPLYSYAACNYLSLSHYLLNNDSLAWSIFWRNMPGYAGEITDFYALNVSLGSDSSSMTSVSLSVKWRIKCAPCPYNSPLGMNYRFKFP